MIRAENISKRYGAHLALDNLSFEVEKGEICGFLGPNGAGKTSMMRILTGFMPPSAGKASIAGFDTRENPMEVKKRIGYLPETTPLYTEMRVGEYLDFAAELKGITSRDDRRKEVANAMEVTRITSRQRSLISSLSKGYKQRVGLAQALIGDPETLILDEPSIGLDPKQIIEIRSLIKDLGGRRTVILSSHILPEVQMICSRVLIINNGKLVASDTLTGLSASAEPKLSVRIAGPGEDVIAGLSQLDDVARVEEGEPDAGGIRYNLFLETGRDIKALRMRLVKYVSQNGWDLVEILPQAVSLEEAYIRLISGDDVLSGREPNTKEEQTESENLPGEGKEDRSDDGERPGAGDNGDGQ